VVEEERQRQEAAYEALTDAEKAPIKRAELDSLKAAWAADEKADAHSSYIRRVLAQEPRYHEMRVRGLELEIARLEGTITFEQFTAAMQDANESFRSGKSWKPIPAPEEAAARAPERREKPLTGQLVPSIAGPAPALPPPRSRPAEALRRRIETSETEERIAPYRGRPESERFEPKFT
jgi:hypothetical protein